jgi:hypothetical protein
MADQRRSQRDFTDARKSLRQEEMQRAIDQGRLIVRQMTSQERVENDARSAAAKARGLAQKRRNAS